MEYPGKTLGPYELIAELGRGGMGVVYRATRADLAREVALKVLPAGATTELVARFRLEAQLAARLRHPNVVGVHDVGEADGQLYLAMDLIEGESLDDTLNDHLFAPRESAELMLQVVEAVGHAHVRGVLHRDIKPGNILLARDHTAYLADFGLARAVDTSQSAKLSRSGSVLGTPAYMSPEQALGRSEIDGRTDVFSCGAVLYEMLTQCLPFDGDTAVQVLSQVVNHDPKPVRRLAPAVPRELEAITHRCLEKDPSLRYADAQSLATDLRRFLDGKPVAARRVTPWRRMRSWIRRNQALAGTAAAGALGIAAVVVWLTVLAPRLALAARTARLSAITETARARMLAEAASLRGALDRLAGPDGRATDPARAAALSLQANRAELRARVLATFVPELRPSDAAEQQAFDDGLTGYAPGPLQARAAALRGEPALAYRADPTGEDGIRGAIALAAGLRERRLLPAAARVLRRLRTRHADASVAREASAVLAPVYAEMGNWAQALAAHYDAGDVSTLAPTTLAVLQGFGRVRQTVAAPGAASRPFEFQHNKEPMRLLDLGARGRYLCAPHRAGAPLFRIGEDGTIAAATPLADHLPPGTWVVDLAPGDVDGDGVQDLLCAVTRPGTGSGLIVLSPTDSGWSIRAQNLSQGNAPYGLIAGDFDSDGRMEAVVPFHWRSPHAWLMHWDPARNEMVVRTWSPDTFRPWIGGGASGDLDGDGTIELAVGTSLHTSAEMLLYRWSEAAPPTVIGRALVGHPGDTQLVPDPENPAGQLLAVMTESGINDLHYASSPHAGALPPYDSLTLLRWNGTEFTIVHRLPVSAGDADFTWPGNSSRGRLGGLPVLLFWADRSKPEEGAMVKEGQRLRFALGDMLSAPAVLGPPQGTLTALLVDVDGGGDGDSELVSLYGGQIEVRGRWEGGTPELQTERGEAPTHDEALARIRAAQDLVDARELDAAVTLLEHIEAHYPDSAYAPDAAHLRIDAQLREAIRAREAAAKAVAAGAPEAPERYDAALAEFRRIADAAGASATRYRGNPARQRRFFAIEADAARRGEDWRRLADASDSARNTTRGIDTARVEGRRIAGFRRVQTLFDSGGTLAVGTPDLPLVASDPVRVRWLPESNGFALTLDCFQGPSVAGVPVRYRGGPLECTAEVELDGSAWSANVYFGVVPRTMDALLNPGDHVDRKYGWSFARMKLHGTTAWDHQSAELNLGRDRTGTNYRPGTWRGRWKLRWAWLPEVDMALFEVRDGADRLVHRDRSRADTPLPSGDYVLGLRFDNRYGDAYVGHAQHPYLTDVRITALTVRSVDRTIEVDRRDPATPALQVERAGGALLRGERAEAIRLYRRAVEGAPSNVRARIYLALCLEREGRPAEAAAHVRAVLLTRPSATLVVLDDACRPASAADRRAFGRVLAATLAILPDGEEHNQQLARAACLGWRGDLEDAQAALDRAAALGESPGLHYLRRKLWQAPGETINEDWEWLAVRNLPLPGTHPPLVLWDAGDADSADGLRAAMQAAARDSSAQPGLASLARLWVATARWLLVDPAAGDALLMQSRIGTAMGRTGISERALRRRAQILSGDPQASLAVAALYARRQARELTLIEIAAAVDRGLRWDQLDGGSQAALWKLLGAQPGFPALVTRAGGAPPAQGK